MQLFRWYDCHCWWLMLLSNIIVGRLCCCWQAQVDASKAELRLCKDQLSLALSERQHAERRAEQLEVEKTDDSLAIVQLEAALEVRA